MSLLAKVCMAHIHGNQGTILTKVNMSGSKVPQWPHLRLRV